MLESHLHMHLSYLRLQSAQHDELLPQVPLHLFRSLPHPYKSKIVAVFSQKVTDRFACASCGNHRGDDDDEFHF